MDVPVARCELSQLLPSCARLGLLPSRAREQRLDFDLLGLGQLGSQLARLLELLQALASRRHGSQIRVCQCEIPIQLDGLFHSRSAFGDAHVVEQVARRLKGCDGCGRLRRDRDLGRLGQGGRGAEPQALGRKRRRDQDHSLSHGLHLSGRGSRGSSRIERQMGG